MADEPDNPVLQMLREIRARLDRHEERFDRIDKRFEEFDGRFEAIDKRFDELDGRLVDMAGSLTYSLGFSMQANVRHENFQRKLDTLEQRVTRLEERV